MSNFYTLIAQFQYQGSTGTIQGSKCFTIQDIPTDPNLPKNGEYCWEELLIETIQTLFKAREITDFLKITKEHSEKTETILRRLNNATTIEEVLRARFSGIKNLTITILEQCLDTTQDNPEIKSEILLEDTSI